MDDHSQNSITQYLIDFNMQISQEAFKYNTGKELSSDQEFAVRYHIYGVIGMFREWLFGNGMTSEYLNTQLYERTPNFLKEAFSGFPYSTQDIMNRTGKGKKKSGNR